MLELSLGHYQEAARRAFRAHKEPVLTLASEVDVMVESAARCGDREAASSVMEAFGNASAPGYVAVPAAGGVARRGTGRP